MSVTGHRPMVSFTSFIQRGEASRAASMDALRLRTVACLSSRDGEASASIRPDLGTRKSPGSDAHFQQLRKIPIVEPFGIA